MFGVCRPCVSPGRRPAHSQQRGGALVSRTRCRPCRFLLLQELAEWDAAGIDVLFIRAYVPRCVGVRCFADHRRQPTSGVPILRCVRRPPEQAHSVRLQVLEAAEARRGHQRPTDRKAHRPHLQDGHGQLQAWLGSQVRSVCLPEGQPCCYCCYFCCC